ncbi:unnamed protein product [Rotaria socialis]|uniref:cyclin-dependent kinase n=1 Tax=Rotaria socialis TaxID=392032 RepID=A0A817MMF2_9BILA|nr:unnamed protein product [Rotaria socialis]CAF4279836.1 unnamed protein product [Rotaria socialis]
MKYVPRRIKDKYEILGIIGEGAYGVVLKARKKDENTLVAIKYFKQTPGYQTDTDVIDRELTILRSLRFENVVELIEWFRDKKRCCLVFEYVEWNMLQVLQQHPEGLPLEQVRRLSYQLFSAINWCHIHEIIHRDIKPENLLISKNLILKLCDFGFARFCNAKTLTDHYTDYVATRWYRSPELLIGSPYGKSADVWACGCIMAELKTGQALFAGENDIDQLYRIQQCLGSLPVKYIFTMNTNPKFQGLRFPPIHHLVTLEERFAHIFPSEMLHLFKNTLRLYAGDRLTAEKCIQHEAFTYLYQTSSKRQSYQSKNTHVPVTASQYNIDYNNTMPVLASSFIDNHLNKSHNDNSETHSRHQSSPLNTTNWNIDSLTDFSPLASSSINQPIKYPNTNAQLTDRSSASHRHQPKIIRAQSRPCSSSSDDALMFSPRSSNIQSNMDDDPYNILLRRTYPKNHPTLQATPSNSNYASNGILLRPKQQHPTNILETSSKDTDKKIKRFSLDQHQPVSNFQKQISESNIYRSSMAFTPSQKANVYSFQTNNNKTTSSYQRTRDEPNHELQEQRNTPRETKRGFFRSRTSDCHSSVDTTLLPQRTFTRQSQHQIVSNSINCTDNNSTVPTTCKTSRNFEQQLSPRHPWDVEQRRPVYGSDSFLMNSNQFNSSANRPFAIQYSSATNDSTPRNKIIIVSERDEIQDPIKSARLSSKQIVVPHPKTPIDSNRRQESNSNLLDVYSSARTIQSHAANTIIPSSHQPQQSVRLINMKSRHHDNSK